MQDWRRAIDQATRNSIFAHRSYVALPARVARRITADRGLRTFGIGVLAVEGDGSLRVVKSARRGSPRVWQYYYELACRTAQYCEV